MTGEIGKIVRVQSPIQKRKRTAILDRQCKSNTERDDGMASVSVEPLQSPDSCPLEMALRKRVGKNSTEKQKAILRNVCKAASGVCWICCTVMLGAAADKHNSLFLGCYLTSILK